MTITVDWDVKYQFKKTNHFAEMHVRPVKIALFPITRPTLTFCADPAVFIAIWKENNKDFHSSRLLKFSGKWTNDLK